MWRPSFAILRKAVVPTLKENVALTKVLYSTKSRLPKSTVKLTLVSASVGILIGVGYGSYTHYKINMKKPSAAEPQEYAFLKTAPEYQPHYKIFNEADSSNLQLVLFQYRTCPFCCKVRAYLDSRGISYEIVEVDAVLRQAIKWSGYKKVPIVLAKVEGGYQQLLDSSAIISVLETHLKVKELPLPEIIKFYPAHQYVNEEGKKVTDISNKYFIMHNEPLVDGRENASETEERKWRQWADKVLVHTLSPNVYRTVGESLETFKWFEKVGGWRDSFPIWECVLMVYGGAAAMWVISKRLKTRHNIKGDARESMYKAANDWTAAVSRKGTRFLGGAEPNLADISVYGILSSIEGCQAFHDLRNNTRIGTWFDDMTSYMEKQRGKVLAVHA